MVPAASRSTLCGCFTDLTDSAVDNSRGKVQNAVTGSTAIFFSTKDGYLFVVTIFLLFTSLMITFGMLLVITRIYLKPIVELWLAVEGESAVEEKQAE